jgi:UDP-N-acetylmuramate: L-alanyl-gamma-D-glutamyl-meso-diaminopimelate ligase
LTPDTSTHIHLIACGGTGMGSLAIMLQTRGYRVTGSDQHLYPPMSTQLETAGIQVYEGFDPANLEPPPDLVIVGNAVSRENVEAVATREAGMPVMSFPQALAHFFIEDRHAVVVTGTHGKSTTTALIAWLLIHAGYDPSVFVGAVMRNFDRTFRLGNGGHMVIEGDEYDSAYFDKGPKFLHYRPRTAVLTSLEFDHADIYRDLDHVRSAFVRFLNLLPDDGCLVACHDQANVRALLATTPVASPVQTYGLEAGAEWQAVDYSPAAHSPGTMPSMSVTILRHGDFYCRLSAPLFGRHNLQNILAAVAVATRLGLSVEQIAAGMTHFQHIKRRCEIRGVVNGITVIDDFAHHPTAVEMTLEGVRLAYPESRLWAVFEPRSATSRRNVFQQAYVQALRLADYVLLADVYRGDLLTAANRLSPETLVQALNPLTKGAWFYADTNAIIALLCRESQSSDVMLIMSNGGFENIHERLLTALAQRSVAPCR